MPESPVAACTPQLTKDHDDHGLQLTHSRIPADSRTRLHHIPRVAAAGLTAASANGASSRNEVKKKDVGGKTKEAKRRRRKESEDEKECLRAYARARRNEPSWHRLPLEAVWLPHTAAILRFDSATGI